MRWVVAASSVIGSRYGCDINVWLRYQRGVLGFAAAATNVEIRIREGEPSGARTTRAADRITCGRPVFSPRRLRTADQASRDSPESRWAAVKVLDFFRERCGRSRTLWAFLQASGVRLMALFFFPKGVLSGQEAQRHFADGIFSGQKAQWHFANGVFGGHKAQRHSANGVFGGHKAQWHFAQLVLDGQDVQWRLDEGVLGGPGRPWESFSEPLQVKKTKKVAIPGSINRRGLQGIVLGRWLPRRFPRSGR